MTLYTFMGHRRTAEHRFTCPCCGKAGRTRKFTVEHTVNPFNKNADGSVRTASEVASNAGAAARLQRDQFATEPLCRSCEDNLSWEDRRALNERRRAAPIGDVQIKEA